MEYSPELAPSSIFVTESPHQSDPPFPSHTRLALESCSNSPHQSAGKSFESPVTFVVFGIDPSATATARVAGVSTPSLGLAFQFVVEA